MAKDNPETGAGKRLEERRVVEAEDDDSILNIPLQSRSEQRLNAKDR